jgi:hypothetical protein
MHPTPATEPSDRGRDDPFPALLASLACALCAVVYSFILIERKCSFILEGSVFTQPHRLSAWEKVAFCTVFPLEIIFLLVGVSAVLKRLARPLLG